MSSSSSEDDTPTEQRGSNMSMEEFRKTGVSINSKEQLALLPDEYLSDHPHRPLLNRDEYGNEYKYALRPLFHSAIFILLIELLERFSYYGVAFTQTSYLTGTYGSWNAGMTSVQATSFVSASIAVAYTAPFLGGILADGLLGDYWEILLGTSLLYIPGLLLIALTTIPHLLGETFNTTVLTVGMLVLWPLGAGTIKSVVNVFGAKQFHPVLQSPMIESYYISFYMVINIGSLLGGIIIPIVAQSNVTAAYFIPVAALSLGVAAFCFGSSRYVKEPPKKDALFKTLKILGSTALCKPIEKSKKSNGGNVSDGFVDGVKQLLAVIPISALLVPFNIAYNQMTTVFIVQGNAMQPAGFFDAAMMNNFDCISVLLFGALIGSVLYPYLLRKGITIPLTYKFAIGTGFGALSILCAIFVDYGIHSAADAGHRISVFFQIFSYMFIGIGEIFAIATVYEATFVVAPKEQKGLASAINLFFLGGIPNFICVALYNACNSWFPENSDSLQEYQQSKLYDYLWVLFGIEVLGILINVTPFVRNWVERIVATAKENNLRLSEEQASEGKDLEGSISEETSDSLVEEENDENL